MVAVHVPASTLFQPQLFILTTTLLPQSIVQLPKKIMRKNNYSQSKPFLLPPSKKRKVDAAPTGFAQSRAGFIDQKLIEGSQQPRSSISFTQESPPPVKPNLSLHDEEPQLDAFDLELLAQESEMGLLHANQTSSDIQTPRQGLYPAPRLQPEPEQKSRFFDPSPSGTSLNWEQPSQREVSSGPPSSPLILLGKRKQGPWGGRNQLEPESDASASQYDATQSSPHMPLSSQANGGLSLSSRLGQGATPLRNIPLSVRGSVLVSVEELPQTYRALFPFPLFNAIQSKCFHPVYNTNDNLVLSAPTGSGKTVVMELAICRLLNALKDERFKVVYQAPTKSLCSERFRDWNTKFASLDLKCAELTGDTDHNQLRSAQNSQIIITTPEKWDSMTRKWKDHMRLMQLVKLFLIDEVHILKETRGATLEAVVSRMKTIGSNIRFVALSATVPNSEDIATWLGKDATSQHLPAHREHFGEDFRPVKLQKFVYGYQSTANDFAFDRLCGSKLPEVIAMHADQKPMMIFCCTRNSATATAKELTRQWTMTNPPSRLWRGPGRHIEVHNEDLKTTIVAGVAFHHAGLGASDRHTVEKYYLDGHIKVICCTSTLAVGVNLPCHLVIIKNTVGWQEGGCREYSDLEMMQMLGRAGRPQFDDSAVAVILTRKERVAHYERLVSGAESLESCLHLNLIEHINAEIGLGNVTDLASATKWLAGTFLFVRLRRNPTHYKLKEGASQADEDELLRQICEKDIKLLQECDLVEKEELRSTQFGDAMARYYIRFETMKILLALKSRATVSQILDVIVQAEEFKEVRLKAGEKSLFREINRNPSIRFPIKVDIALPAHKISLLLQTELGGIDFPGDDPSQKHKFTFQQDKNLVFAHVNRLIRCVIDCLITREDSISILNALELARSFGAKVWDSSPLQMKQIEQIGVVAVRKLAAAGITSLEVLEDTEPHRIEMALSKNPPFGAKLLARLKDFPKLRVAVKMAGKDVKNGSVKIRFQLEVAFMNDNTPVYFQRRPVYVCCLTETSDGRLVDFRRISSSKLQQGLDVTLTAEMKRADEAIICHAMCDDIAGTARQAEFKPDVPAHLFPATLPEDSSDTVKRQQNSDSQPLTLKSKAVSTRRQMEFDAFDGDDLQLDDFLVADKRHDQPKASSKKPDFQFDDADWLPIDSTPSPPKSKSAVQKDKGDDWATDMGPQEDEEYEIVRLPNGNWACNHKCRDKTSCKHFCCREGLEKPPRPSKKRTTPNEKAPDLNQLTLAASMSKQPASKNSQMSTQSTKGQSSAKRKNSNPSITGSSNNQSKRKASNQSLFGGAPVKKANTSKPSEEKARSPPKGLSSDFGSDDFDDLPSPEELFGRPKSSFAVPESPVWETTRQTEPEQETACVDPAKLCIGDNGQSDAGQDPIVIDSTPETGATQTTMTTQASQAPQSSDHSRPLEIWDDHSYSSGEDIFTNTGYHDSTATTAPLAPSTGNTIHSPKRKVSALDEGSVEQRQNRSSGEFIQNTFIGASTVVAPESTRENSLPKADDASTGWEDIDRGLYEEFQHLINFY